MHLLRTLFFLKRIYFTQTRDQILYFYFLVLFGFFLLSRLVYSNWPVVTYMLAAPFSYFLVRTCLRSFIVKRRVGHSPDMVAEYVIGSRISESSMSYELDRVDGFRLLREDKTWKIYDAIFNFYQKTKNGEFLSKQAYYTVYEGSLLRQVPHLVFDSKRAKRRQFKYLYLQSQRLSLEGGFDKYFDVYSPQDYQVDTLSFITPEVMEAIIALKDYDIELIDDKVLCFGPLLDLADLDHLQYAAEALTWHLNDNLDTYRDNRLSGTARSVRVSSYARALLKSPMKYVPMLVLSIAGLVATLYFGITISYDLMYNQLSFAALGVFVTSLYKVIQTALTNRRLQAGYKNFIRV